MKNMRIGLVGLVGAVAGFALQACFTPQPAPECQVTTAASASGVLPYFVKLTKVDGAAPCDGLTHMYMGLQRFHPPGTNDFTVGYRAGTLVDMINGEYYTANYDPDNDCIAGEGCDLCVSPDPARAADGGLISPSGEVVLCPDDTYSLDDGSACDPANGTPVDVENTCELVPDGVPREDPSDPGPRAPGATPPAGRCPDGKEPCPKKAIGYGKFAQFPDKDGLCAISETTAASQAFQQESIDLIDGGTQVFPATTVKLEWTNFNVYNTTKIPYTAFKGNLKLTDGTCSANYKALAFVPVIHCARDTELADGGNDVCDPFPRDPLLKDGGADPDCGLRTYGSCTTGSTINPLFNPKCNLALGVCEPNVDLDKLK